MPNQQSFILFKKEQALEKFIGKYKTRQPIYTNAFSGAAVDIKFLLASYLAANNKMERQDLDLKRKK